VHRITFGYFTNVSDTFVSDKFLLLPVVQRYKICDPCLTEQHYADLSKCVLFPTGVTKYHIHSTFCTVHLIILIQGEVSHTRKILESRRKCCSWAFLKFYHLHFYVGSSAVHMVSYCGGNSYRSRGRGCISDVRIVPFMWEVQAQHERRN
jgi:hypothetical protein